MGYILTFSVVYNSAVFDLKKENCPKFVLFIWCGRRRAWLRYTLRRKQLQGFFLWYCRWQSKHESRGGSLQTSVNRVVCVFSKWPLLQTSLIWGRAVWRWLRPSASGSQLLPHLSLLIWVWKLLLIKVSKGEMKRSRNWAAWAALFPLCMVAAPAEVFHWPQGLAEVAGDVATIAQGQGRNHSPLTGFKELGNYAQVAKWIDVSACQQFLQKTEEAFERQRRGEPHLMSNV